MLIIGIGYYTFKSTWIPFISRNIFALGAALKENLSLPPSSSTWFSASDARALSSCSLMTCQNPCPLAIRSSRSLEAWKWCHSSDLLGNDFGCRPRITALLYESCMLLKSGILDELDSWLLLVCNDFVEATDRIFEIKTGVDAEI